MAGLAVQDAEIVVAVGQVLLKVNERRIGVGQLLSDLQRPRVRTQSVIMVPVVTLQEANAVVAECQFLLERGDAGAGVYEPLVDLARALVCRERQVRAVLFHAKVTDAEVDLPKFILVGGGVGMFVGQELFLEHLGLLQHDDRLDDASPARKVLPRSVRIRANSRR